MTKLKQLVARFFIGFAALLLILIPPAASAWQLALPGVAADAAPVNGIDHPTGSDAKTYTYNPDSGLWENDYYTFNPTTKQTRPKQPLEYTYNATTGRWDSQVWEFHPSVDAYEQVTISIATPPAGAITHGGPAPVTAPAPVPSPATPDGTPAATSSTTPASATPGTPSGSSDDGDASPSPLQPSGASSVQQPAGGLSVNNVTGVTLDNNITSNAQSGDALGQNNYNVGDVTSGDAASIATIINLLQSTAGLSDADLATFVRNIQGDVSGDLLIDPAALLQGAGSPESTDGAADVDVNNTVDAAINNNIDLAATSGNATINDNYSAGDATTGTASAVANVVNLINSVIAANQSFLGVVNIYGNYTGNILVPQNTLDTLLASNSPTSAETAQQASLAAAKVTNTANQSIANNVDLNATSGSATQHGNTTTGSATTGNAMTNLTILNLTGHQVTAANSLLVFVNVLGTWVGVIMDAPAGATSAALTGGAEPSSQATSPASGDTSISSTTNAAITNNITAHATSGDASATNNFRSGDTTSGDATASANIVNMMNSAFSLSHWFGVLFINVFGSWIGNFGAATPAPVSGGSGSTDAGGTTGTGGGTTPAAVFRFVPGGGASGGSGGLNRVDQSSFANDAQYAKFASQVSDVLAAHDIAPSSTTPKAPSGTVQVAGLSLAVLPIALGLVGFAALGAEKIHAIRKRATTSAD